MSPFQKVLRFRFSNFIKLSLSSLFTIGGVGCLFIAFAYLGFPFAEIKVEKFFDLGFFSVSIFGLIIFLTMIPFQAVQERLSPGFFSRISSNPRAHFGLYVLITSAIICFLVIALQQIPIIEKYLSELFLALTVAIIFAIIFHHCWVIRHLYQPYVVYNHIKELKGEESVEETWLELFECVYKAIKQGRVSDARNIINLITHNFNQDITKKENRMLYEDLTNLYTIARECRPIARLMEKKWPFLLNK